MTDDTVEETGKQRISTGIDAFDGVLEGGLIPGRSYMVRGPPGAGKTIMGLQFLTAADDGSLFVNLGQAEADVRSDARDLGFDLGGSSSST